MTIYRISLLSVIFSQIDPRINQKWIRNDYDTSKEHQGQRLKYKVWRLSYDNVKKS